MYIYIWLCMGGIVYVCVSPKTLTGMHGNRHFNSERLVNMLIPLRRAGELVIDVVSGRSLTMPPCVNAPVVNAFDDVPVHGVQEVAASGGVGWSRVRFNSEARDAAHREYRPLLRILFQGRRGRL